MDNSFGACTLPVDPRRRTVVISNGSCSLERLRPGPGSLQLPWHPRQKQGIFRPLLPAYSGPHPRSPWGHQGVYAHRYMFYHDFAACKRLRSRPGRPPDLHQPPPPNSPMEPRITSVGDSCAAASPWQVPIRWQRHLYVGSRSCASMVPPPRPPAGPSRTSPPLHFHDFFCGQKNRQISEVRGMRLLAIGEQWSNPRRPFEGEGGIISCERDPAGALGGSAHRRRPDWCSGQDFLARALLHFPLNSAFFTRHPPRPLPEPQGTYITLCGPPGGALPLSAPHLHGLGATLSIPDRCVAHGPGDVPMKPHLRPPP